MSWDVLTYSGWLARQAIGFVATFWPVTVVTALLVALTWFWRKHPQRPDKEIPIRLWWKLLSPFCVTVVILVVGATMEVDGSRESAHPWATEVVFGLLVLQLTLSAALVWWAPTRRLFVVALSVFQLWISTTFAAVAIMSVTGNWI
jgi:hypothetical protein